MQPTVPDLSTAVPARFPGERRRRGTNWGLRNQFGEWLHTDSNIAAFDTASSARRWIIDPQSFGKDRPMTLQQVEHAALAQ